MLVSACLPRCLAAEPVQALSRHSHAGLPSASACRGSAPNYSHFKALSPTCFAYTSIWSALFSVATIM